MTVVARRLWLYGLLLLLPALAMGALALGLLARERARLAEREQAARESRRAAVESRARLIAENIELLVGDVQSALMATLQEAPENEPRPFLTEWQATNPLVRDVFRASAQGRVIWGAQGDPLRAWLGQGVPWENGWPAESKLATNSRPSADLANTFQSSVGATQAQVDAEGAVQDGQARKEISTNVLQYNTARRAIQEVAKLKNYADVAAKSSSSYGAADEAPMAAVPAAPPSNSGSAVFSAGEPSAEKKSAPEASAQGFLKTAPQVFASEGAGTARSGWSPWRDANGVHVFGWRELSDRTVIGLELRLDAIKARLGDVFPATPEPGEAYALRDAVGAAWHRVGPERLPVVLEVPLAAETLPGWTVVARMSEADGSSAPNGFFLLGAALVGLLVLAIIAAGALLVRQARLSELEAAQKTSFVTNVSHELKTPLTTIRLYAELLAEGRVREEAKRADYLATIGRETQRLGRLVANVLDFSRLEQGRKKYAPAPLDLAAELRRLAEVHSPRLAACGLSLHLDAPETLPLTTDRDAVEQIVLNLFDNACKYAADGGEVALRLAWDDPRGCCRLAVADRGPGVPAAQRERIFEKFHRVDDRLTAERSGAGLGLSIARQLARGLGGDLRCEARADGGAEFVLTLPLSP